jgi:beta-mannosidase
MYYSAKDIYEPVIIFPYLNDTSQTLEVWVTSDLWEPISGIAQFSWVDWAGNPLPLPYDDS